MKTFLVQINNKTDRWSRCLQRRTYSKEFFEDGHTQYIIRAENADAAMAEAEAWHVFFKYHRVTKETT